MCVGSPMGSLAEVLVRTAAMGGPVSAAVQLLEDQGDGLERTGRDGD